MTPVGDIGQNCRTRMLSNDRENGKFRQYGTGSTCNRVDSFLCSSVKGSYCSDSETVCVDQLKLVAYIGRIS